MRYKLVDILHQTTQHTIQRASISYGSRHFSSTSHPPQRFTPQAPFAGVSTSELLFKLAMFKGLSSGLWGSVGVPAMETIQRIDNPALTYMAEFALKHSAIKLFFGGVDLAGTETTARKCLERGQNVILDYSPEGDRNYDNTARVLERVATLCHKLSEEYNPPTAPSFAVKVSTLADIEAIARIGKTLPDTSVLGKADQQEWQALQSRMRGVFTRATELGIPTIVDAEQSYLNPVIDALCYDAVQQGQRVIETLQAYDVNSPVKAQSILQRNSPYQGVKIVRGAYLTEENVLAEKEGRPSPIFPSKEATDANYDALLLELMKSDALQYLMAATHNEKSFQHAASASLQNGVPVISATLYGMGDNLVAPTMPSYKYLPFLKEEGQNGFIGLLAYFSRRVEENAGGRGEDEASAVMKELKRRANQLLFGDQEKSL